MGATDPTATPGPPAAPPPAPRTIARYTLLEPLGEGGMGVVYKAQQTTPVTRLVALKLIKPGLDTKAVLARFDAERQALALMDHPSIARVLDAGADDAGRPFFVMELVPGLPLTTYCDQRKFDLSARLALFATVCDAVHHAHQKGVIHRDLKPSNILVSDVDGRPLPKVIDFGVAKATAARPLAEATLLTTQGQLVGTPEYMSPEQADFSPLDVDTRSDVYSLGVVLYELLAGVLPFDRATLRQAALNEIQRIIRDVDAPRPSTRLTTLPADSSAPLAANRRTSLPTLAAALRSELEWIPLKALRKDRNERYRSAAELADDVRNYLADRPLIAAPESPAYRLRKLLRRNRGPATAAALVAAALLLGIAGTTWQAVAANRARRAAEASTLAESAAKSAALAAAAEARAALAAADAASYFANIKAAEAALAHRNPAAAQRFLAACPPPARHVEWGMLMARADPAVRTFRPHPGHPVRSVAVSPDGTRILTAADDDHAAVISDVDSGLPLLTLRGHTAALTRAAFSPDGKRVFTASHDRTARAFDAATGAPLLTFPPHPAAVTHLAVSPDGARLATACDDNAARVFDAATTRPLATLAKEDWAAGIPLFAPDGRRVVTGSGARPRIVRLGSGQLAEVFIDLDDLTLWDPATAATTRPTPVAQVRRVSAIAYSPDGSHLAVGDRDGYTYLLDTATGARVKLDDDVAPDQPFPDVYFGAVVRVAFSRDGKRLLTAATDGVHLWDVSNPVEPQPLEQLVPRSTTEVTDAALSPEGGRAVVAFDDGTVRVFAHPPTTEPAGPDFTRVGPRAISPDGAVVVAGTRTAPTVLLDARTAAPIATLTPAGIARFASFSPDSRRVLVPHFTDHTIHLWQSPSGEPLPTLAGHTGVIAAAIFSPDGGRVLSTSEDSTARLWDTATGRELRRFDLPPPAFFTAPAFSPDGSRLLLGATDGNARLYGATTGRLLATLAGHTKPLSRRATFSPDGRLAVTCSDDRTARVWDLASATCLLTLRGHVQPVRSAAFSPDARRIATFAPDESNVRIWDARTGAELLSLADVESNTWWFAFSPDGTQLLLPSTKDVLVLDSVPPAHRHRQHLLATGKLTPADLARMAAENRLNEGDTQSLPWVHIGATRPAPLTTVPSP